MVAMICDPLLEEQLIARRQETGADRYDEVWEGMYVMTPMPNNEHQDLVGQLTTILEVVVGWQALGRVFPGVNVSDRKADWQSNFRCPDIAVFLNDTRAENCDTFWYGGPDFAVEVISPSDRSREKLTFYAAINTRELLLIDRDPWGLELYRLDEGVLQLAGRSSVESPEPLAGRTVPLSFNLSPGKPRPQIEVRHDDGQQSWTI